MKLGKPRPIWAVVCADGQSFDHTLSKSKGAQAAAWWDDHCTRCGESYKHRAVEYEEGRNNVGDNAMAPCPLCGPNCYARALNAPGNKLYDENAFCPTCGEHQLATGPPCGNGCDDPKPGKIPVRRKARKIP